ncbi:MAG: amidohydrolase family protein, partial [Fibrella sp.]|nr:amidohydrolase family protein [Armatimonadota bacterium]
QVAGSYRGFYISHVRDEEEGALDSFREVIRIAREARLPAQISHIKLASSPVGGKEQEVFRQKDDARRDGLDISADVYPYTYWQSGIIVLMPPEYAMRGKATVQNWDDKPGWEKALGEIGGAKNILVTGYAPEPGWQGKTIDELAVQEKKDPVALIQDMVRLTNGTVGVVVTAMRESDLKAFLAHPRVMFCTDGGLRGSHPRGAGSYPRILGKYVREDRVLPLEEAIRKMTALPAARMGFGNRGTIAPGKKADLALFDPRTVRDTATTKYPHSAPIGITDVLVNGTPVLQNGRMTGERPGQVLRRT